MVEQMLAWYGRIHGVRSLSLRYFNAAGASFDAALGEHFDKTLMLIPMLMQATLGRREPLDIYGTDYPTLDGTAVRDYIHVVDLADAHTRALDAAAGQDGAMVLNLGTGVGSSVKEVIGLIEQVTAREVPVRWTNRRPRRCGGGRRADPTSARGVLGWEARYDLRAIDRNSRRIGTRRIWMTEQGLKASSGRRRFLLRTWPASARHGWCADRSRASATLKSSMVRPIPSIRPTRGSQPSRPLILLIHRAATLRVTRSSTGVRDAARATGGL